MASESKLQNHHLGPREFLPGGSRPHKIVDVLAEAGVAVHINSSVCNMQALSGVESPVLAEHNGSHGG